jgi:hypothetical protein
MKISKDKTVWGALALSTLLAVGTLSTAIAETAAGKTAGDPAKAAKIAEKKAGQQKDGQQKDGVFKGKVSEVGGGKITLVNRKEGQTRTFTVTNATKVTVSEKPSTLADVKVGLAAGVKADADGKVALELQAWVPHQVKSTEAAKAAKAGKK